MLSIEELRKKKHLICVGFEKCGTTAADQIMRQSPRYSCPTPKETFFFERNFHLGHDWYYERQVDIHRPFIVDFTPAYHLSDAALDRIAALPNKELFIFVRDPISRAFSFYWHDIAHHFTKGDIRTGYTDTPYLYTMSFEDHIAAHNRYYFTDILSSIERIEHRIPKTEIHIFHQKDVLDGTFTAFINERFSSDIDTSVSGRWNAGGEVLIEPEGNIAIDCTRQKFHVTLGGRRIRAVPTDYNERLLYSSQFWTRHLSEASYKEARSKLFGHGDKHRTIGPNKRPLFRG